MAIFVKKQFRSIWHWIPIFLGSRWISSLRTNAEREDFAEAGADQCDQQSWWMKRRRRRRRRRHTRVDRKRKERLINVTILPKGAAIAQWIRLRLPSCWPRFESQVHHLPMLLSFIVKFVLYLSCEKNENKQKRPGLDHLKTILPKAKVIHFC